jgi:hypothetical protein
MAKKPTRRQKELIASYKLNPLNWLVLKNPAPKLYIRNRQSGHVRIISELKKESLSSQLPRTEARG